MKSNVPHQVGVAVSNAGLPVSELPKFLIAFTAKNSTAPANIPGATPTVLGDMKKTMNYRVDAPVEDLTAKSMRGEVAIMTSREKSG
jgi:hypothetical protein